jgi:hypothetical protein
MKIGYSIPGGDEKEALVFPFPHTDSEFIFGETKNRKGNVQEFSFLKLNEENKTISIKTGKNVIEKDLFIPAGYSLIAGPGVEIDFRKNAGIISYSSFIFIGSEDDNIIISSSDSSSSGIEIISAPPSVFENVLFRNLPQLKKKEQWHRTGALTFYESSVKFRACSINNCSSEDAVSIIRSSFSFKECLFKKIKNDALDADFSDGTIEQCVFEDCNESALDLTMTKIKFSSLYVNKADKAILIKNGSELKGSDLKIKNAGTGIIAEDLVIVDIKKIQINDTEKGIVAYTTKKGAGKPSVRLIELVLQNVKKSYLKDKQSLVNANGMQIQDNVENVETLIKSEKKKHP